MRRFIFDHELTAWPTIASRRFWSLQLGVAPQTLSKLPTIRVGRSLAITKSDVLRFIGAPTIKTKK